MVQFSVVYSAVHQKMFSDALERGKLERAVQILYSLPLPSSSPQHVRDREEIERLRVINEGLVAVLDRYEQKIKKKR